MSKITLSSECTVYEIAEIHQQIHDNWKAGSDLELDVSAVSAVDASFVQLLVSCRKQAELNECKFKLTKPTEILNEKIKAMFITDYFAVDPVTA